MTPPPNSSGRSTSSPPGPTPGTAWELAEYGVGDSQISFVTGLKTMLGKDALTRSAMAFAKSAEIDPCFVRGLVDLANTALRQRVNIKLGVALEALRRSAATPAGQRSRGPARARPGRARGGRRRLGAGRVPGLPGQRGPNRSLGQLEVARTLFLLGRFDGLAPYFEGAASDDSVTVAGYRADLATIASDSVMGEFDRTAGRRRAAYLKRSGVSATAPSSAADGERLREHYRRLFYARKNFQLTSLNRHYDIVERYRSGSRDFDDRGVIYIRHGEPTSRASYAAPGLEPNESWRYSRTDGDMIFHFIAREDVQDFKLVESLFDVLGFSNALALRGGLAGSEGDPMAEQLMLSREQLAPIYRRLQAAGRISTGRYQTEERQVGQESIALGTTSDSYELRFPNELKASSEVLAVGRDSTGTQVQIAYAISGSSLEPVTVTRGYLYCVRLRFVATDRHGQRGGLARHHPPLRGAGAGPRRRAPGRPGGASRCRRAASTTAWPSSRARRPASCSRPTPFGWAGPRSTALALSDLVLGAGTPISAGGAPRRIPSSSIRSGPTRGRRRWSCTTRSRGSAPAPYTVRSRCGSRVAAAGYSRRSSAAAAAPSASSSRRQATRSRSPAHRSLKLDRLKPGNTSCEVLVEDDRTDGQADAAVPGGGGGVA